MVLKTQEEDERILEAVFLGSRNQHIKDLVTNWEQSTYFIGEEPTETQIIYDQTCSDVSAKLSDLYNLMYLLDPKAKSVGVPSDFNPDKFGRKMN